MYLFPERMMFVSQSSNSFFSPTKKKAESDKLEVSYIYLCLTTEEVLLTVQSLLHNNNIINNNELNADD